MGCITIQHKVSKRTYGREKYCVKKARLNAPVKTSPYLLKKYILINEWACSKHNLLYTCH
jgi:hypothetical protein